MLPVSAIAAPCTDGPMTTGERTLFSIFRAVDELGRRTYDSTIPGDVITFRRDGGRWRAIVPRAAAARARANGCDLAERIEDAAAFFGPSVDFANVRVIVGEPVMESSFVFHQRVKIGSDAAECPSRSTLVHEFAHVWQYQHGQWQATMGLVDQLRNHWIDVYSLDSTRIVAAAREGRSIDFFIRERQAELFVIAWEMQQGGQIPLDPEYARAVRSLVGPALSRRPCWPFRHH